MVFYVLLIWVLFRFLIEVFGRQYSLLIFLAVLFYAVHPLRTEVVASLKSRDELFSALFSLLACTSFVRYLKHSHWKYLAASSLLFLLAPYEQGVIPAISGSRPIGCIFQWGKELEKNDCRNRGTFYYVNCILALYGVCTP